MVNIFARTLVAMQQPIPKECYQFKSKGGTKITFVSWYMLCDLLDSRVGLGCWSWDVINITCTDKYLFLTGKLTIYVDGQGLSMCATGSELLNCTSFGDPSSNAEAMALRRACSKFGMGRELWHKDKKLADQNKQRNHRQVQQTAGK